MMSKTRRRALMNAHVCPRAVYFFFHIRICVYNVCKSPTRGRIKFKKKRNKNNMMRRTIYNFPFKKTWTTTWLRVCCPCRRGTRYPRPRFSFVSTHVLHAQRGYTYVGTHIDIRLYNTRTGSLFSFFFICTRPTTSCRAIIHTYIWPPAVFSLFFSS